MKKFENIDESVIFDGEKSYSSAKNDSSFADVSHSSGRNLGLDVLCEEFNTLRMEFLVRCKFPVYALLGGPLQETWQNNVIVRGQLLRRMQCMNCKNRYGLVSLILVLL